MAANDVRYRLGLDMGTNSIGWAAIRLDDDGEPRGIVDMGVRIFPDGRQARGSGDGPSNAAHRRERRGQRRRRDRYLNRRKKFMSLLIKHGLMPQDESERKSLERLDPYKLRVNALGSNKLPAHHIGRALFHLNQRRGFKSNRKSERQDDDTGPAKEAARKLSEQLVALGYRTLGEFLYEKHRVKDSVRFRNLNMGTTKKAEYEFYPTRQMILDEFDAIWTGQSPHHREIMTEDARESLLGVITYNKKAPPPQVGKCTLDPASDLEDKDGFRCEWAHPLAQRFRIWEEVRNLRVQETGGQPRPLSKDEGDRIVEKLLTRSAFSFDQMRTLLNLPPGVHFNLESERRKGLLTDQTAKKLAHKNLFGPTWRKMQLDTQIEIVEKLLEEEDEDVAIEWLVRNTPLNHGAADRVASAFLPEGHCRIGLRAIRKMRPYMEEKGMDYDKAARAAGYDPIGAPTRELSPTGKLPRYNEWLQHRLVGTGHPADPPDKRYGRYPNPTVHIGLNQLRRVVNLLIKEYGRPEQVVVEVTRDLKGSKKRRADIGREQAANQKKNDARNAKLKELGLMPNYENRLKMRLWEELNPQNCLDRRCLFTGEVISLRRLFSDEVEIDHLIPWKDSLNDSPSNKIVCMRGANRGKGRQTPYEAFSRTPEWEDIKRRVGKLPKDKQKRFGADAREWLERQGGFLDRQLNETGWLSSVTREYMMAVVPSNNIWVIPGRLTDMIRYKWGLDSLLHNENFSKGKNRNDHRHHAIDAFVVALTSRSLLQRMSSEYDQTRSRIKVSEPWNGFRGQLERFVKDMVVSHKPDHGTRGAKAGRSTTGQLHKDTAYGIIEFVADGVSKVVRRKPLPGHGERPINNRKDLEKVRDPELRKALIALWDEVKVSGGDSMEFGDRAATEGVILNGHRQKVRRVRVVEHESVVPIRKNSEDGIEKPYKGYRSDSNEFADIWRMSDKSKNWKVVALPTFYANSRKFDTENFLPTISRGKNRGKPDLDAKHLMRVYKGDMGALGENDNLRIVHIRQVGDGYIILDNNNEANLDRRERRKEIERNTGHRNKTLREEGFRKVRVDEIGRVYDPGPFKP